ncbi:regulatory protein ArsR [Actinoplanes sp. N902-109]|nr:regulatory protein ArsR [Actinoplanes sp. N902-109]
MGDDAGRRRAFLRATAHPVRLQILSLLSSAALTAADVARELGLTHANASYHLRNLLSAGVVVQEGEERIRGGVAKRYRYDSSRDRGYFNGAGADPDTHRAMYAVVADELIRRTAQADWSTGGTMTDAELWVDPEVFLDIRERITQLSRELHAAAQPPRTPGTVRTSTTVAMFRMTDA